MKSTWEENRQVYCCLQHQLAGDSRWAGKEARRRQEAGFAGTARPTRRSQGDLYIHGLGQSNEVVHGRDNGRADGRGQPREEDRSIMVNTQEARRFEGGTPDTAEDKRSKPREQGL